MAVVGSLNLDLVVGVGTLPGRGETVVGSSVRTMPGGKGANQAAAAATLAPSVALLGRVGDDAAGRTLVDDLAARGVDVSGVLVTAGTPTGTATVAVESGTGENLIVVAPGANAATTAADVTGAVVRSAAVVLLQLEIPLAAVLAAAAAASGTVVLNPAPAAAVPAELLARADVLVPNEGELERLAGVGHREGSAAELAALARRVTARDVVVTRGAQGALVVPADGEPVQIAPPSVEVLDTTGAGDCFCGALCAALARGDDLVSAARYAVAAAALSTTGAGARGALPTDAEIRAVLTG